MKQKSHPASWVPTVYFAMGLPFVAIAAASSLMFKNLGISDSKIAFWTTLIMIPWTLKPLWSPLLEMFKTKKHFVVATQMITGITFALVALSLPLPNFFTYSIALMAVIAFSGSTHDIATVGIYLNELSPKDQAKYVGWQGAFYNVAKILSGGALVYLAGELEQRLGVVHAWMIVMGIYGVIMVSLSLYHIKMLPSGGSSETVKSFKEGIETFKDVAITFFQKKNIILSIAILCLPSSLSSSQAGPCAPFWLTQRESSLITPSTALAAAYFPSQELAVAWMTLSGFGAGAAGAAASPDARPNRHVKTRLREPEFVDLRLGRFMLVSLSSFVIHNSSFVIRNCFRLLLLFPEFPALRRQHRFEGRSGLLAGRNAQGILARLVWRVAKSLPGRLVQAGGDLEGLFRGGTV
jgi:hypothetical protein